MKTPDTETAFISAMDGTPYPINRPHPRRIAQFLANLNGKPFKWGAETVNPEKKKK